MFMTASNAGACTRVIYSGSDGLFVVGRSLDWSTPIPTNLYVYPRGMEKVGNVIPNSVRWTSKYGAVYAVGYDGGITEGMNEKGLVVNGLFCKGAVYVNSGSNGRAPISLSMFQAWILDLCSTTQEAVDLLQDQNFSISGASFDGGKVAALHWGITDAMGNTAVLEFNDGQLKIYQGTAADMPVLTNDPAWPSMNAINDYWQKVGGVNMLPGTVTSPDRFVRAHFFTNHVRKTGEADLAASICRSILMAECVPFTYAVEGEPNISSTQWRSMSNLRDKRYYFELVTGNGLYYIDLNKCDLRKGAPVMKLDNTKSTDYTGEANRHLFKAKPFIPMY